MFSEVDERSSTFEGPDRFSNDRDCDDNDICTWALGAFSETAGLESTGATAFMSTME